MKLIEMAGPFLRQKKFRELPVNQILKAMVVQPIHTGFEPGKPPQSVFVHNEVWELEGVAEDGISGFRPNSVYGKEVFSQFFRTISILVLNSMNAESHGIEPLEEGFQLFRFLVVVPCASDQHSELFPWKGSHFSGIQEPPFFEVPNSLFHVLPAGVLGQDGPDDDLKRSVPWPPVGVPQGLVEAPVDGNKKGKFLNFVFQNGKQVLYRRWESTDPRFFRENRV